MKLTEKANHVDHWKDLLPHQYIIFDHADKPCGVVFKCPGCGEPLAINNHKDSPHWDIDFETLTASPSILHSRNGMGCGWHGYLVNGELKLER